MRAYVFPGGLYVNQCAGVFTLEMVSMVKLSTSFYWTKNEGMRRGIVLARRDQATLSSRECLKGKSVMPRLCDFGGLALAAT